MCSVYFLVLVALFICAIISPNHLTASKISEYTHVDTLKQLFPVLIICEVKNTQLLTMGSIAQILHKK